MHEKESSAGTGTLTPDTADFMKKTPGYFQITTVGRVSFSPVYQTPTTGQGQRPSPLICLKLINKYTNIGNR
jgi:hypothetical protein